MGANDWPALPVFYATSEGQTERIAQRLADRLRERGLASAAVDLANERTDGRAWNGVRAAALCASIHYGKHQRVARRFGAAHRAELGRVPSLFVSVSLAIRSENEKERRAAEQQARSFAERTGWSPDHVACVAGRLAYTRYGWLKRLLMKRIAKAEGGSTDTSRDHEYTDWSQVDSLADDLAERAAIPRS